MVASVGRWANGKLRDFSYALGFFYLVLRESILFVRRRQVGFRVLVMQILFTGVDALGIVALIALSIGAVIIVEGGTILPRFGQTSLLYTILIVVIARELGPLLTAFIIIARSGTAITTELGNMVVSHEIEAYLSIGVSPISYLVVPRFFGVIISLILLTIYFDIFGLIGSFLVSQLIKPVPFLDYFQALLAAFSAKDILATFVKSIVFGVIISVVATYQGFRVRQSVTEVPRAAIRSVGQGFVLCFLADALITVITYV
jgi:phospholipid/cholesterol/gamma-HCH transport system permease protein